MRTVVPVLAGGLVAGALDILYAIGFWRLKANVPASRILQSVAAGLLGTASFSGGTETAMLGLVLHFGIAVSMAFVYLLMAQNRPELRRRPVLYGALYGVGLWAIMNFVVVPLSSAPPGSKDGLWIALSILVHAVCIGIPIALSVRRALPAHA